MKEETINLRKDNLRKIKLQDTTQLEITHSNAIIINHYHKLISNYKLSFSHAALALLRFCSLVTENM